MSTLLAPPSASPSEYSLARGAGAVAEPRPPRAGAVARRSAESPDTKAARECLGVLQLINGEHFAGAERVQVHLGRRLPEFGYAAGFVCLKPGRFAEQFDRSQGWLESAPMRGRFDLRAVDRVVAIARQRNVRLLHAHTPRSAMIASRAARRLALPWVYHLHSPTARDSSRSFQNLLNRWIERRALRRCDHLIAVSHSLRDEAVRQGWPEDRVTVVHNGVPAVRSMQRRSPRGGEAWRLGMVALMRPRKGLEVALEAIALLRRQGLPVSLRCIGPFETPSYERQIGRRIESLGLREHVDLAGFCDDVPSALSQLDAMVLPSLYGEGLPMVVLEAMASGLPVVATRVEGTPEAIRDRREGLLADPGSAPSLADRLAALVTGRVAGKALAWAARQRHGQHFSDRAMAAGTAEVYGRVLVRELIGAPAAAGLERPARRH
jgi:glycosyltransferase involved in cell wall biosynthesis